jgi:hypothetical protein
MRVSLLYSARMRKTSTHLQQLKHVEPNVEVGEFGIQDLEVGVVYEFSNDGWRF